MTKILSRRLRPLADIFRLPGQRTAPQALGLEQPITTVADLERMAELGACVFINLQIAITTDGAGTVARNLFTISNAFLAGQAWESELQASGIRQSEADMWLLESSVQGTIGGITFGGSSVEMPAQDVPDGSRTFLHQAFNDDIDGGVAITTSDAVPFCWTGTQDQRPSTWFSEITLPLRVSSVNMVAVDNAAVAGTARFKFRLALTPRLIVTPY